MSNLEGKGVDDLRFIYANSNDVPQTIERATSALDGQSSSGAFFGLRDEHNFGTVVMWFWLDDGRYRADVLDGARWVSWNSGAPAVAVGKALNWLKSKDISVHESCLCDAQFEKTDDHFRFRRALDRTVEAIRRADAEMFKATAVPARLLGIDTGEEWIDDHGHRSVVVEHETPTWAVTPETRRHATSALGHLDEFDWCDDGLGESS